MTFKQHFQGLDFIFYLPGKPISNVANCFIEISGKPQQTVVRNFPVLKTEITFNLSGMSFNTKSAVLGAMTSPYNSFVTGTMTTWQDFYLPERMHIIGVNLKPEVFQKFFHVAPFELTDNIIGGALCNNELDSIWYKLMETKNVTQRFNILHRWVRTKISQSNCYEDGLVKGIKEQCIHCPSITVRQLERWSGYSRQYLFMKFREHVGINVKQYLELIRFQRILRDLKAEQYNNFSALAYKHNFYDQPHFIHSFKRLTGLTPSEVRELFLPKHDMTQKGYSLSYT